MVTAHASLGGKLETWAMTSRGGPGAAKRSDGYCAVRESGAGVAVKANHDSDGEVRWSTSPVADGLDSSHGSVDKANINPEVAGEHHTG